MLLNLTASSKAMGMVLFYTHACSDLLYFTRTGHAHTFTCVPQGTSPVQINQDLASSPHR